MASLFIVILGGIGLIISSSLMLSHRSGASLESNDQAKAEPGDGVMVNVYAVDPSNADFKGKLLHSEITDPEAQLDFAVPDGVEPPYLLEFQTLGSSFYAPEANYIN
ncbi:hypothetical protein [Hahella sp. CCB-MM4]|uniref:hypothetical protein n=1 Tax=Hahella sp. (strain CCB-MM4) TaxID=1926491 RepID=UPI000B9AEEC6|nr:hypothetical protein [Hahella sp. CCB-MM4]